MTQLAAHHRLLLVVLAVLSLAVLVSFLPLSPPTFTGQATSQIDSVTSSATLTTCSEDSRFGEISINFDQFSQSEAIGEDALHPGLRNQQGTYYQGSFTGQVYQQYSVETRECASGWDIEFYCEVCDLTIIDEKGAGFNFGTHGYASPPHAGMNFGGGRTQEFSSKHIRNGFFRINPTDYDMSPATRGDKYYRIKWSGDTIEFYADDKLVHKEVDWNFWRVDESRVKIRTNVGRQGLRGTLTLTPLPDPDKSHLLSDFNAGIIDVRDFGFKEAVYQGSISKGSNQLRLSQPANLLEVGDSIIVEIGGETGQGKRGTVGVGGFWPTTQYSTEAEMREAGAPSSKSYAYVHETDKVYLTYNGFYDSNDYYAEVKAPLSLSAEVVAISADRRTLTLDEPAQATATNALVHFNNVHAFREPHDGYLSLPTDPPFTIRIPEGRYAMSGGISIRDKIDWKVLGAGQDKTLLYAVDGAQIPSVKVTNSPNIEIADFTVIGNVRNEGYYPGVSSVFTLNSLSNGLMRDLTVIDVDRAFGTSYATNAWGEDLTSIMHDGNMQYRGWNFIWADGYQGGCRRCVVIADKLTGGMDFFGQRDAVAEDVLLINAVAANNGASNWRINRFDQIFTDNSMAYNPDDGEYGVSVSNPAFVIVDNPPQRIHSPTDFILENYRHVMLGYLTPEGDQFGGLSVNHPRWDTIRLSNILMLRQDTDGYSINRFNTFDPAIFGVDGSQQDTTLEINNIRGVGKGGPDYGIWTGAIRTIDASGRISNCIVDTWVIPEKVSHDCKPNDQALTTPPTHEELAQQIMQDHNVDFLRSRPLYRLYQPREGPSHAQEGIPPPGASQTHHFARSDHRLKNRWFMMGMRVDPYEEEVANVVPEDFIIRSQDGGLYLPHLDIDTIRTFESGKAYFVQSTKDATFFAVKGDLREDNLRLNAGWNYVSPPDIDLEDLQLPQGSLVYNEKTLLYSDTITYKDFKGLRDGQGYRIWVPQQTTLSAS